MRQRINHCTFVPEKESNHLHQNHYVYFLKMEMPLKKEYLTWFFLVSGISEVADLINGIIKNIFQD